MPDGSLDAYIHGAGSGPDIAKWYDALELMDDYEPLQTFLTQAEKKVDTEKEEERK